MNSELIFNLACAAWYCCPRSMSSLFFSSPSSFSLVSSYLTDSKPFSIVRIMSLRCSMSLLCCSSLVSICLRMSDSARGLCLGVFLWKFSVAIGIPLSLLPNLIFLDWVCRRPGNYSSSWIRGNCCFIIIYINVEGGSDSKSNVPRTWRKCMIWFWRRTPAYWIYVREQITNRCRKGIFAKSCQKSINYWKG